MRRVLRPKLIQCGRDAKDLDPIGLRRGQHFGRRDGHCWQATATPTQRVPGCRIAVESPLDDGYRGGFVIRLFDVRMSQ
jgi:hypothetical protein